MAIRVKGRTITKTHKLLGILLEIGCCYSGWGQLCYLAVNIVVKNMNFYLMKVIITSIKQSIFFGTERKKSQKFVYVKGLFLAALSSSRSDNGPQFVRPCVRSWVVIIYENFETFKSR